MPTEGDPVRVNCAQCHGTGKTLDELDDDPTCSACDGNAWFYA